MRGKKLFNNIANQDSNPRTNKKGRSDRMLEQRNTCLLARYYFYSHFSTRCFEDILQQLTSEFFLTPVRINKIIQENFEVLKEFKERSLSLYRLKCQWPQFKW